jgi:hypothetical protein
MPLHPHLIVAGLLYPGHVISRLACTRRGYEEFARWDPYNCDAFASYSRIANLLGRAMLYRVSPAAAVGTSLSRARSFVQTYIYLVQHFRLRVVRILHRSS